MELLQALQDRRSIRKYKDTPVGREAVEHLLEAARLAPSWKNQQCWRFLVVTDAAKREKILAGFGDDNPGKKGIAAAPVTIVVCADPAESGIENGIHYYVADTAMALEHLCLAATEMGLGTCWMGLFNEDLIRKGLGIPPTFRIVGITPLGYPDQDPKPRPRKELNEIAYFEKWGEN
ncbi:nitroreductase family protein [Geobacter anodireducens]|uniref:Nitroreductase family protein n=1 Tax=Geobacter anodireducens TaxID=1340425 RepID=A0ABR9NVB5_9BACT|nr:nitroreductase family protein [Geobacter anodireducens]MBE2888176.1 nitroreductase family protein [Geobacter anodireducens]